MAVSVNCAGLNVDGSVCVVCHFVFDGSCAKVTKSIFAYEFLRLVGAKSKTVFLFYSTGSALVDCCCLVKLNAVLEGNNFNFVVGDVSPRAVGFVDEETLTACLIECRKLMDVMVIPRHLPYTCPLIAHQFSVPIEDNEPRICSVMPRVGRQLSVGNFGW